MINLRGRPCPKCGKKTLRHPRHPHDCSSNPALALCLALASPSHALFVDYEQVSGYKPAANGYGINYAYSIGFIEDAIRVDVDVRLWGATVVDTLLARWERGIEEIWSTDRFTVPILFDVEWVSATDAYDHSVRVVDGPGRWNTGTFYTATASGWGDAFNEEVAAHEFGHFIGNFDQYWGGALDPSTMQTGTGGLMETLAGGTLDMYYSDFLGWYEDHLTAYDPGDEPIPTPEPSTVVLFAAGMFALAVRMKRQSA